MASVISKALKITGELESTEDIQIDGQIEGDVRGVGVKIGQNAKVKGAVYGEEVELAGSIDGKIEAKKVILTGTARMTGDVLHQDIKIESGAFISGSLKPDMGKPDARPAARTDVRPDIKPAHRSPPAPRRRMGKLRPWPRKTKARVAYKYKCRKRDGWRDYCSGQMLTLSPWPDNRIAPTCNAAAQH